MRSALLLRAAALAALALSALQPLRADPFTIGYVYAGPKNDSGWYASHDAGRLYVEGHMPGVVTKVAENVPETSDSERVMERMARSNVKLIFAASYGYFEKAERVAKRFPGVAIMHSGDGQVAYHVGNYFGSTEECMYISGIAAGLKTTTGKLGYIDAHPIPLQLRGINAFAMGARSVNPKATVQVIFLDTWKDPTKEAEAANSLIDQGVDVLAQELDSNITTAQVAEKRGISFIGQYTDASGLAPHAWLIGNYFDWGPMMVSIVKEVQAGTWKERPILATLAGGQLKMTPYGPGMPAAAKPMLDQAVAEFTTGGRKLWQGPILAQDGSVAIPAGTVLSPDKVTNMDFFVQGVVGTLGK